jgi:putative transposase
MRHCGCARLAYNVCLAKWNADFETGVKHNYFSIKLWFNAVKQLLYPFMYEVSKWAVEAAIADLGKAFVNYFAGRAAHPTFHRKGVHDSFRIDGSVIKVVGNRLKLPKGLFIRMAEPLRFEATKIYNVTVSRRADMWFASIQCEVPERENQASGTIGIDLGVGSQAVLSDGTVYPNIGIRRRFRRQLARAQRNLARKQKGSRNRAKAQMKLARLYYRLACVRSDNIHQFTTAVTRDNGVICLEDLNVSGMMRNHHLAGAIADVSFYEIRRQFGYKAREVRYVDRFAPTSKTCSGCGAVHEMPLSKREMNCGCGLQIDRDLNAAMNILRWATPEGKACGQGLALVEAGI